MRWIKKLWISRSNVLKPQPSSLWKMVRREKKNSLWERHICRKMDKGFGWMAAWTNWRCLTKNDKKQGVWNMGFEIFVFIMFIYVVFFLQFKLDVSWTSTWLCSFFLPINFKGFELGKHCLKCFPLFNCQIKNKSKHYFKEFLILSSRNSNSFINFSSFELAFDTSPK